MTNPVAGERKDGSSSDTPLHRAIKVVFGERAKNIYVRVFAFVLFVLGASLTFIPHVFDFFSHHLTDRPEILPVTLMVPYVYLIFEMVLSRLERDEDSTDQVRHFEARLSEVRERRLERKTLVEAFNRSMEGLTYLNIAAGTNAVSEWIAAARQPTIEVQILAYSSETLLDGLIEVADRLKKNIDAGIASPKMIIFKLLTRNLEVKWQIPCLSSREADEAYRRGLNARFGQYLSRWNVEFFKAFDFLPRDAVVLDVRWYPFEPTYKAIIVNQKVGVVGVYDFDEVNHKGVEGWDYHGQGMRMYEVRADGLSPHSKRALKDLLRLFDELWNDYSRRAEPF